jgi:IS4 transposase
VERHEVAADDSQIIEDAAIRLNNRYVKSQTEKNQYYSTPLRRIEVRRPDKNTPLILVTNDFDRPAHEIAALYKKRWDIELFFKWIKQNLRIKHFLGRSENAVKIQIYTALISYLLLQVFQRNNGIHLSLKLCLATLRIGLFQRVKTEKIVSDREKRRREQMREVQPELAF